MPAELPPPHTPLPLVTGQPRRKSGFTLLETLVALALLVVLTMVIVAVYRFHLIAGSQPPDAEGEQSRPARSEPATVSPQGTRQAEDSQRKFSE